MKLTAIAAAITAAILSSTSHASTANWYVAADAPILSPDPFWGAPSSDGLSPLQGVAATFRGYQRGGSQAMYGNAHRGPSWQVVYSTPVQLMTLNLSLIADGTVQGSSIQVLDNATGRVIASQNLAPANILEPYTLNLNGYRGRHFTISIYSGSTDGIYVQNLQLSENDLASGCVR